MIGENLLRPEPTLLPVDSAVDEAIENGDSLDRVVRAHPESPLAWALLADEAFEAGREIEAYAFARVGYHRGLDSLRRAGWKGVGPVPWNHEPNRGVLRALYALRRSAEQIGETAEFERLTDFLNDASADAITAIESAE